MLVFSPASRMRRFASLRGGTTKQIEDSTKLIQGKKRNFWIASFLAMTQSASSGLLRFARNDAKRVRGEAQQIIVS